MCSEQQVFLCNPIGQRKKYDWEPCKTISYKLTNTIKLALILSLEHTMLRQTNELFLGGKAA